MNGSLITAGCNRINQRWAIKILETKAILEGLEAYMSFSEESEIRFKPPLVVESDSSTVINVLNHEDEDQSKLSY